MSPRNLAQPRTDPPALRSAPRGGQGSLEPPPNSGAGGAGRPNPKSPGQTRCWLRPSGLGAGGAPNCPDGQTDRQTSPRPSHTQHTHPSDPLTLHDAREGRPGPPLSASDELDQWASATQPDSTLHPDTPWLSPQPVKKQVLLHSPPPGLPGGVD